MLLYAGNYGVAHEVDTVAEGYARHHREGSRPRAVMAERDRRRRRRSCATARRRRACRSIARRRCQSNDWPACCALPDAHLVTLKDGFIGYVMPSKIYACIDSGRPQPRSSAAPNSDVDLLARSAKAGYWRVPCGDVAGFAEALEQIANSANRAGSEEIRQPN